MTWGICVPLQEAIDVPDGTVDFLELGYVDRQGNPPVDADILTAAQRLKSPVLALNRLVPGSLNCFRTAPETLEAYFGRLIRHAHILGAQSLILGSGLFRTAPPGLAPVDARKIFEVVVQRWGGLLAGTPLTLLIEPLSLGETNLVHGLDEAREILEHLSDVPVALAADLYHLDARDRRRINAFSPWIRHFHVAEPTTRRPPRSHTVQRWIAMVRRAQPGAPLSLECRWEDLQTELPALMATLRGWEGGRAPGPNPVSGNPQCRHSVRDVSLNRRDGGA